MLGVRRARKASEGGSAESGFGSRLGCHQQTPFSLLSFHYEKRLRRVIPGLAQRLQSVEESEFSALLPIPRPRQTETLQETVLSAVFLARSIRLRREHSPILPLDALLQAGSSSFASTKEASRLISCHLHASFYAASSPQIESMDEGSLFPSKVH